MHYYSGQPMHLCSGVDSDGLVRGARRRLRLRLNGTKALTRKVEKAADAIRVERA